MADYLHGAYGRLQALDTKLARACTNAIVYVGTAPVHTVEGGGNNVNKPALVTSIAQARKLFGYSDDWENYTLCEAMHVHLEKKAVAPLVLINVMDPAVHKKATAGSASVTPVNGRAIIVNAEDAIVDTVAITGKTKGEDYTLQYDYKKKNLIITEAQTGSLGTASLSVTYQKADPAAVTEANVIGTSDGVGLNTGIQAVRNVYHETGYIPSFLLAPGFAEMPNVHRALIAASRKINGHWDAYVMADLPLTSTTGGNTTPLTMQTAAAWKQTNGYTSDNETVYFPMAKGVDERIYHLSVLAAANLQELLIEQDGIPYKTASNTPCGVIANLFMGAGNDDRVFDDTIINQNLNRNGIASAAFVGGQWVIWGCHSADYSVDSGDQINVFETNRMMLYYISNDFQNRRTRDVDKPMTLNDIRTIVAEEQTRMDALRKIGAITHGVCTLNAEADERSDILNGDYSFTFNVTTTPLARSLTAVVNWTDEGFTTYYAEIL